MPLLPRARLVLAFAAVLAAGCQDYNFNPVGHCLIQPGSRRVTLSDLSSADVLFVVDDSGSMGGEQDALAQNFSSFIARLDAANAERAAAGLDPFDFHIAVTTTSVYQNVPTSQTCTDACGSAAGQFVCCNSNTPILRPRACTPGVTTCPGGTECRADCTSLKGENYCCDPGTGAAPLVDVLPCTLDVGGTTLPAGSPCGNLVRHYSGTACTPGVGVNEWTYPRGDFVSWTSGSSANPRVLHFDKELYTGSSNRQGFTRQQLIDFFAGGGAVGGNVTVGTCGSAQEQALQAARLSIEKALASQQKDTYARVKDSGGNPVPTWTSSTRTASSPADWLTPGSKSKLVLVFVGDEDDCSSKVEDPSASNVLTECTNPPLAKKLLVDGFADYVMGLGRPVGVAVIASFVSAGNPSQCSGESCLAQTCCQPDCPTVGTCGTSGSPSWCGGQAPGTRLLDAANQFRTRGAEVVVGSVCDPQFDSLLQQIAEIVKPPTGLTLPSLPAESDITVLRITTPNGQTRKICGRPLAPGPYPTLADAQATHADWWFTATATPGVPVAVSPFVYINLQGSCIANPGETYSADYLGQLPEGGCVSDADCAQALGGQAGSWTCYAGVDTGGACVAPTALAPGTCICGDRGKNCPSG